jgi:hypothetical protein
VCDGGRGVWREAVARSHGDDDDRAPAATVGGKPWDSPSDRHRVNTAARSPFLRAVFTGRAQLEIPPSRTTRPRRRKGPCRKGYRMGGTRRRCSVLPQKLAGSNKDFRFGR